MINSVQRDKFIGHIGQKGLFLFLCGWWGLRDRYRLLMESCYPLAALVGPDGGRPRRFRDWLALASSLGCRFVDVNRSRVIDPVKLRSV